VKLEVIRKSELIPVRWSGGTTTQLAIFPKDASYIDRNFQFRLSTSEVSVDESVFTFLPGVSRVLLVLDGELRIFHPGRYAKALKKFDSDTFMGDWQTRSTGKATDFNLMTTVSIHGHLEGISLKKGSSRSIELSENHDVAGIYAYKGEYIIQVADHRVELLTGDNLLIFTDNKTDILRISSKVSGELVLAEIQF
jgi:environmental stress-induced protein Ves